MLDGSEDGDEQDQPEAQAGYLHGEAVEAMDDLDHKGEILTQEVKKPNSA